MSEQPERVGQVSQIDRSQEYDQYLKILSIFHYVVGGLAGLFACFPIIHFLMGLFVTGMSFIPMATEDGSLGLPFIPMTFMGLFFTIFAGLIILVGWTLAVVIILNGRFLALRKRHTFCMVVAGIECLFMPFGTVLGIFTIIVLTQPVVQSWFEE